MREFLLGFIIGVVLSLGLYQATKKPDTILRLEREVLAKQVKYNIAEKIQLYADKCYIEADSAPYGDIGRVVSRAKTVGAYEAALISNRYSIPDSLLEVPR